MSEKEEKIIPGVISPELSKDQIAETIKNASKESVHAKLDLIMCNQDTLRLMLEEILKNQK